MKTIIQFLVIIALVAGMGVAFAEDGAGAGAGDTGGLGGLGDIGDAFGDLGGSLLGDGPGLMGLDPADLGMGPGSYTMVGAPGAELPMPNFGADAWVSAHIAGIGGAGGSGYAGLSESTKPELVMIVNNTTNKATFYNRGMQGIDIGGLRLVKVIGHGSQKKHIDIAELPYTLVIEGGKSETLDLYENVTSGDKLILTNGLGTYTGLKIP